VDGLLVACCLAIFKTPQKYAKTVYFRNSIGQYMETSPRQTTEVSSTLLYSSNIPLCGFIRHFIDSSLRGAVSKSVG
jgi:hypothetical protein